VATTVFNAAWEAGLSITERNPHSLYISRYQLGRDATVYWPSLDLKFANDTDTWVLVKGFVEGDGISVAIYGGESRRVESSAGTFEVTGRFQSSGCRTRRSQRARRSSRKRVDAKQDVRDPNRVRARRLGHPRRDVDDVLQGRRKSFAWASRSMSPRPSLRHPRPPSRRLRQALPSDLSALATASTNGAERASVGTSRDRRWRDACSRRRRLAVSLDAVLVPEPRSTHVRAPRPYPQPVVEVRGSVVRTQTSVVSASTPPSRIAW
jgi:hypothetical protein